MKRKNNNNMVCHMTNPLVLRAKGKSFIAFLLVLILVIFSGGCVYGDTPEESGVDLLGIKVLSRPLSYDYNGAVPEGSQNYYEQYAADLLTYLYNVYGIVNQHYFEMQFIDENVFADIIQYNDNPNPEIVALAEAWAADSTAGASASDTFLYFYDAMRYQITSIVQDSATGEYLVRADIGVAWNWSLPYNLPSGDETYSTSAFLYEYVTDGAYAGDGSQKPKSAVITGNTLTNRIDGAEFNLEVLNGFYTLGNDAPFQSTLQNAFNAETYFNKFLYDWDEPTQNGEFVKALAYAIYSIVLGLRPNTITVSYNETTGQPLLTVAGYEATADKSSVDNALEDITLLFYELGSYVGLTQRDKDNLSQYIIENVIGDSAYRYNSRMKYDEVVEAIVNYCGSLTQIGVTEGASEDDRGDDLDQAYAASELKDYPYATFFLDAVEGDGFHAPASEYQSFVFMPLTDIEVSDLWLDFKYDANNDGNEVYDPNLYLDIEVHYRYFNGETVIDKVKNMRVYDGPPDPGEDSTTLEAELFTDEMFGENIKIGPFENPDPINTAINHDEGVENTLTLTGFTEARKYYELIDSPTYGGYGVLNHELFSTPYFEIAFAVRKTPGDTTTNYNFSVAVSNFYQPTTWPGEPEWH